MLALTSPGKCAGGYVAHDFIFLLIIEGSLEVKLPTIWTDEKQRLGRGREKRTVEERESEKRKGQKKADADARKVGKSRNTVFPMI